MSTACVHPVSSFKISTQSILVLRTLLFSTHPAMDHTANVPEAIVPPAPPIVQPSRHERLYERALEFVNAPENRAIFFSDPSTFISMLRGLLVVGDLELIYVGLNHILSTYSRGIFGYTSRHSSLLFYRKNHAWLSTFPFGIVLRRFARDREIHRQLATKKSHPWGTVRKPSAEPIPRKLRRSSKIRPRRRFISCQREQSP